MTIVRDDSGTVNVYMTTAANGTELAFTADDSSALDYVAADSNGGSIVRLFQEDPSNIEETSEGVPGGKLYGFEAWPGVALTEEEVTEAVASLGSQGSAAASQAPALASTGVDGAAASWLGALSALAMLGGALVLQRVRRQNAA